MMCAHDVPVCTATHHDKRVAVTLIGPNPLPSGQRGLLTAITGPRYQVSFVTSLCKKSINVTLIHSFLNSVRTLSYFHLGPCN